jgi:outer membrane protein TolC
MKSYKPSNDLHRAAEMAVRNEERLTAYIRRRAQHAESVNAALRRVALGESTIYDAALLRAAIAGAKA